MKWLEMLRQKRVPRESNIPQSEKISDETPQGKASPKLIAGEPAERLALLTPRERELFRLLLEGYTLKESAKQLSVKYSTANTHMTGVYKKLDVKSRAELIIRYRDTAKKNE